MKKKLMLVLGIIILGFALSLDYLGLNTKEGFGLVQLGGIAVGAILIIFSFIKTGTKKK